MAARQQEEVARVADLLTGTLTVRAGGGVVWQEGQQGAEVLLVHRPRYDDWTFPKGKAEPGETDEE